MNVEEIIKRNRAYGKRLDGIGFTVSANENQVIVKFGKKYNVVETPNKEAAELLVAGFNATIENQKKVIDEFCLLMEQKCQQLDLFKQFKTE